MAQIIVAAIGRMRGKAESAMAETYLQRIRPALQMIEFELPDSGKRSAEEEKTLEAAKLLAALPSPCIHIVMDEKGKNYSSVEFARRFAAWRERGLPLAFLLGGANGHGDQVKASAAELISMGAMTWPHKLARIMLLEQIYRAQQICAGHPYHRA